MVFTDNTDGGGLFLAERRGGSRRFREATAASVPKA
jgi:hypothetical protein